MTHSEYINGKTAARLERDREFMANYKAALELAMAEGVPDAKRAAVRWTIYNSSPRYYVSYERAYKVVRWLLTKPTMPLRESLQLDMWREIARRVAVLTADRKISVARALDYVLVHCRASRFFITEDYAYDTLVDRARRERRLHIRAAAV